MGRSETTSTLHWRSTDVGRGPGPGNAETAVALLHYLPYFGHKTFLYGYEDSFHDLCFKKEYNDRVLPTVADVFAKYQAGDIKTVISLDWSMDDYLGSKAFFLDHLKGVFLVGLFDGFHDFNRTRADLYDGMFFQDYLKVMRWKEMGMRAPAFRSSFGFIRHAYHHTQNRSNSVIFLGRMRASSKITMLCKCAKEDLKRTFYFTLASGKDRPPPRDSSDAMKKHCTSGNVVYLDRNRYSNEDIQNLVEASGVGIDFSWPGWQEHHTNSKVLNYIRNGLVPVVELPSQYAPVAVRYGGILVPNESDCATWIQAFEAASRRMAQAKPFLKIVGGHMTNWPSIFAPVVEFINALQMQKDMLRQDARTEQTNPR